MSAVAFIGTVAAICTTVAFVPQIAKLWKQGGKDLSYSMLALYLTGIALWLVYGIRIHAAAVIWANAATFVLVLMALLLKATPRRPRLDSTSHRLRIAVDMDEVIADSFSEHVRRYNRQTGEALTKEMVSHSGLRPLLPAQHRETFSNIPGEDGFFADLGVIEGSQAALAHLSQHHDIFITSAAMEVPTSFDAKFKWLEKHFPFIPPARIVFCGDKHIVNADVLIDDRSRHFKEFTGTGILFTAPHNAGETAPLRANNWDEVLQILSDGRAGAAATRKMSRTLSMNPAES
jgi:5'(3')-deoxyribonucleotidase/uncharacterized protein with PQ loop repeat